MKRGRFDADYERVKRKPPPQTEFPDETLFDREREERAAQERESFRRRMALLGEQEEQGKRERKLASDARTVRANHLALMREYERARVAPPLVNEEGTPSCSLSLLLQMGWSIEQFGDTVTLVKPRMVDDRSSRRSNNRPKPAAETNPPSETSD